MNEETHRRILAELAKYLAGKPRTAKQIAAAMHCSLPTAYLRLRALEKSGTRLASSKVRQGSSGPEATAYSLA